MNSTDIAQSLLAVVTNQNLLARVALVITLSVYTLFALVLNRQIGLLSNMVDQITFSPVFKAIAIIHVLVTVALLLYVTFLV